MHNLTLLLLILTAINTNLASAQTADNVTNRQQQEQLYWSTASQFLSPQNAARARLRMRPLQWDSTLAMYAHSYANQRRNDCQLRHSNGPFGENIFWGSGTGWNPGQAVTSWTSERRWYNYWTNSCFWNQQCGHYTQIVWRNTQRVGCAKVTCNAGRGVFMICNYYPPGNYIGERPY
ncbi:pathogenesis-related protein PR-1-like [Euphorbia lathyris]|uniref:pathogenesis-related protein PR-1-like n=1 Tax=Euphorbia lathyris TaxID=212925 RepID=UPI0033134C71